MYALADINNFYVSAERLFRPDLKQRPVVVLSNNDGCIISRSQEAKRLGIAMGVPLFKVKSLIEQHHVVVFSSNYPLYADISTRVMATLETLAAEVEIYSIDEAFLNLTGMGQTFGLAAYGQTIKQTIAKSVGVPICVGIGPTKTLAKLANHAAKHYPATQGVVDLSDRQRQLKLMALVDVGEVWGVGRRLKQKLNRIGVHTALDLANAHTALIRQLGTVVLERTQAELNGEVCDALALQIPQKKQIICSRAFSRRITARAELQEAISNYASRAGQKLRAEQAAAGRVTVFIRTSPFSKKSPYYSNSATTQLIYPSSDTRDLIQCANKALDAIWRSGFEYAKAGVMLSEFSDPNSVQLDLFQTYTPPA